MNIIILSFVFISFINRETMEDSIMEQSHIICGRLGKNLESNSIN
jgi:hypothetical protein